MAFSQAEAVRLSNENKIPAGTVVLAAFLTNGLEAAEARAGLAAARIAKIGFSGDAILTAPGMSPGCDSGLSG
jgi:hypothetical protein